MKINPVLVFPTKWVYFVLLMHFIRLSRTLENELNHSKNGTKHIHHRLPVLYDSSSFDAEMQKEMVKAVLLALGNSRTSEVQPLLIDITSDIKGHDRMTSLQKSVSMLLENEMQILVSLVDSEQLIKFVYVYDNYLSGERRDNKNFVGSSKLHIYTPRTFSGNVRIPDSVSIKTLQMSEAAHAVALLNRVRKTGVKTLIPILDDETSSQLELLTMYHRLGKKNGNSGMGPIKFTKPILLNDPIHKKKLRMILQEHSGFHENFLKMMHNNNKNNEENHDIEEMMMSSSNKTRKLNPGILLLSKRNTHEAIKIAADKRHLLLSWFSPNILETEDWVNQPLSMDNDIYTDRWGGFDNDNNANAEGENSRKGTAANNSIVGLYSVSFVGSGSWDNPSRRRALRELTTFAGNSPRIVSLVLAYDAALLAQDQLNNDLQLPTMGLSGDIDFNENGFRKNGIFLGATSVPEPVGLSQVALLQPSTWILEDFITVDEIREGHAPKITDYDVATSSILTREELLYIANTTRDSVGCREHLMDIVSYDSFTQMPHHYFFTEANLPEIIMVPNHQGFGITFICSHDNNNKNGDETEKFRSTSTLQIACAPGHKLSHPVNCFRSHIARRQKRAITENSDKAATVPSVQYQYSFSGKDPWSSQWAASKQDGQGQSPHYYQPNRDYQVDAVTYGYLTTRLDVPINEESSTTPAPAAGASKLPELRQVLKAAKPFVGSCIGSSTGCAICVLVLGRLPLGNNPTACTGPCFVGTFGSCGALLGRVFSETTVICTELFRQGMLDTETFVADAEFGNYLSEASPFTMKGYTLLATPLVSLMQSSKLVTDIVATFALPWAHHMKYVLGRTEETNLLGNIVHLIGYPACNIVGRLVFAFDRMWNHFSYCLIVASPFLTLLVTLLLYILAFTNLGFSTNHKRIGCFQIMLEFCTLLSTVLQKVTSYFKAIGRST